MKAQILKDYGDADAFVLDDSRLPSPRSGEVRVRVHSIGLNPMDAKIRSGALKDEMATEFPAILGSDFSGIVDKVGDGVGNLQEGDQVAGLASNGAYAEFAVARADILAPIPDGLGFDKAAAVPTAAEASQRAIRLLEPKEGETVVVNGAAGSVGSAAVQLLARSGVRVIGTASEDNHDYVSQLGAEPTAYGDGVVDRIRELAPKGVDAVFDVTGHGFVDAAIELRGGPDRIVTISDFAAAEKGITVSYGDQSKISAGDFSGVMELAASGDFVVEIADTFAFENIAAAHKLSEQGHLHGKIVIEGPDTDTD